VFRKSHPVRVRGLKPLRALALESRDLSHPVRVRGLKHFLLAADRIIMTSHPVRVRGLKPYPLDLRTCGSLVAPRAGAWVETGLRVIRSLAGWVAPRAGAWVETPDRHRWMQQSRRRTPCGCVG